MPRLVHYSDIENVFDAPDRAARLAARLRDLDGPDAAVVGSGDNTAPGVLSLVARGRQAVDFYAVTDTTLDTFGNHEFDYGPDALCELVERAPVTFVSANVRDETGERFGQSVGVRPHATLDIDGVTVGFVGLTDPATDTMNPRATRLSFDDPIRSARRAIETLREIGAEYIVVLSHLGAGDDELARTTDVDAILGGHVHNRRIEYVDGTLLVRPGVNGRTVAEIDLAGTAFASRTESLSEGRAESRPTAMLHAVDGRPDERAQLDTPVRGGSLDATGASSGDRFEGNRPTNRGKDGGTAPRTTDDDPLAEGGNPTPEDGPCEKLRESLAGRMAEARLDDVITTVTEPIERTGDVIHGGECRVGNFVADAFRWAFDADVGLSNAGGIRQGDPLEGSVTRADLISLVPFEEPVVLAEVTGNELCAVFAEMTAPVVDWGEPDWWHGHVSRASIVWDDEIEELVDARVDGDPVDPTAHYSVATSEYLLHSEHEFPTLRERHRAGEGDIQYEVLCEYANERGIDPRIEGRIRIR